MEERAHRRAQLCKAAEMRQKTTDRDMAAADWERGPGRARGGGGGSKGGALRVQAPSLGGGGGGGGSKLAIAYPHGFLLYQQQIWRFWGAHGTGNRGLTATKWVPIGAQLPVLSPNDHPNPS